MHYIENKSSVLSLEMWLEVKEYPKLCNVLNYLLLLASVIVVSYFFFISAASTLYFFFPTCIRFLSFFFFFCLIALNMTSIMVLNTVGKVPGWGHGNPLHYSCLENPMDTGAWRATVYGVAKSWTQLKWHSTHACVISNSRQSFFLFLGENFQLLLKWYLLYIFKLIFIRL